MGGNWNPLSKQKELKLLNLICFIQTKYLKNETIWNEINSKFNVFECLKNCEILYPKCGGWFIISNCET